MMIVINNVTKWTVDEEKIFKLLEDDLSECPHFKDLGFEDPDLDHPLPSRENVEREADRLACDVSIHLPFCYECDSTDVDYVKKRAYDAIRIAAGIQYHLIVDADFEIVQENVEKEVMSQHRLENDAGPLRISEELKYEIKKAEDEFGLKTTKAQVETAQQLLNEGGIMIYETTFSIAGLDTIFKGALVLCSHRFGPCLVLIAKDGRWYLDNELHEYAAGLNLYSRLREHLEK